MSPIQGNKSLPVECRHPRIEGTPSKAASNSSWLMKWSLSRSMYPKMSRNIDILCDGKHYPWLPPFWIPKVSRTLGTGCLLGREISAKMKQIWLLYVNFLLGDLPCGWQRPGFRSPLSGEHRRETSPTFNRTQQGSGNTLENEPLEPKNWGLED